MVENIKIEQIFIKSRGRTYAHDYMWADVLGNSCSQVNKPELIEKYNMIDYIQSDSPFLLLAKFEKKIIFFIGGLNSTRKDISNTTIRNTLFLVFDDNDNNEILVRSLSIKCLLKENKEKIEESIDKIIKFSDDKLGFSFEENELNNFFSELLELNLKKENSLKEHLIAKNTDKNKDKLIEDLENYSFPKEDCFIFIITNNKSKDFLIKANAYRTLSLLIENEKLEKIKESETKEKKKLPPVLNIDNSNTGNDIFQNDIVITLGALPRIVIGKIGDLL